MKFQALASSSAGNAYIVSDNDTRILLECGVTHKNLQKLSGFSLSEFQACLVSHEHKDHAKAVAELISRGMEVYMSQGTAEALDAEAVTLIEHMEQFNVGSLDIVPFTTFHDAKEPLGFLIKSRVDGDVLAFATDRSILLTGLINPQVVRTSEMMDMRCVVFVRGKQPTDDIIEMAKECGIVVLTTDLRMYTACGLLYANGLQSGSVA